MNFVTRSDWICIETLLKLETEFDQFLVNFVTTRSGGICIETLTKSGHSLSVPVVFSVTNIIVRPLFSKIIGSKLQFFY